MTPPEPQATTSTDLVTKALLLTPSGSPLPSSADLVSLDINTHYALTKDNAPRIDTARMLELAVQFADRNQNALSNLALRVAEIGALI